jgi:hypothetical protein
MTSRPWIAALAIVLVGCGSSASRSTGARSTRGPTPTAARPPVRPTPPTATRPYVAGPTAPVVSQGPRGGRSNALDPRFWRGSLQEALSDARSTNRLVFLEMGRDGCGNCIALKNKVIPDPAVDPTLKMMSVGFYDDIDRNRDTTARNILQQNLPTAVILPLAGWVTPDMRWVSGFSGRRDAQSFLQEVAKARAISGQRAEAERPVPRAELVVAEPAAGSSLSADELADVTAALGEDVLPAGPAPLAGDLPAVAEVPAVEIGRPDPALAIEPPVEAAPMPATAEVAHADPVPPPSEPPPSIASPTATVGVTAPTADPVRTWAHDQLERAAAALAARDYAGARAILAEVRVRASGLPEQREAEKGEVAIRLLKKLDRQAGDAAKETRTDAATDLKGTIWVTLFA